MTKTILFIILGLTTVFSANTFSQNMSEKNTEQKREIRAVQKHQQVNKRHQQQRAEKRQYQTEQKRYKTERKNQRQKVDQRQYITEKKNQYQRIENRNKKSEQKSEQSRYKAQRKHKQQKMDRNLRKRDAVKRNFRTHQEFKKMKKRHQKAQRRIHHKASRSYFNDRRAYKQRGYRHYRQAWYLDFFYDRASFYDRYGYYYGYFNRVGYLLEGIFYRYDRYYTFRDRVRGRGIFDHRYYRPYIHNDYYNYDDPYYRRY